MDENTTCPICDAYIDYLGNGKWGARYMVKLKRLSPENHPTRRRKTGNWISQEFCCKSRHGD